MAVMSSPLSRSLVMTGVISVSSRTRSPITIAWPCIGAKATQPPSARAGLIWIPSSVTCRSDRGRPYRWTSPLTVAVFPSATSTFFQSMDCAWAIETNGSAKTFQSIDCAVVAIGNNAARANMVGRAVLLIMVVCSFNSGFWKARPLRPLQTARRLAALLDLTAAIDDQGDLLAVLHCLYDRTLGGGFAFSDLRIASRLQLGDEFLLR